MRTRLGKRGERDESYISNTLSGLIIFLLAVAVILYIIYQQFRRLPPI
jgi:hypothetical protein